MTKGDMGISDLEANEPPPTRLTKETRPIQALAEGIFLMNTYVETFKRLAGTIGTPEDTPEVREKLYNIRQQIRHLVDNNLAICKEIKRFTHRTASEKGEFVKLAKDYRPVLKEFQTASDEIAENIFAPFVPAVQPSSSVGNDDLNLQPQESEEWRALKMRLESLDNFPRDLSYELVQPYDRLIRGS